MAQEEPIKNDSANAPSANADTGSDAKREMSTIQFPYGDLDDAMAFARAIHEVGGQGCLAEQLAGFLKVAPSGGAFRARMAHPRIFGLIEYDRGEIKLTSLGLRAVDPQQEAGARVDAFLAVPLYKALYDRYKGYTLPPPAALEREMALLGVSSKQTDKARQVFDRSAKQAGFFWAGNDRLTLPVIKSRPETRPVEDAPPAPNRDFDQPQQGSGGSGGGGYHPFIEGLLKTLPATGKEWASRDRAKWLKTAANMFDLIYEGGDAEIEVRLKAEEQF
ncbi:MAG: hypothetical protein CTY25_02425 [Methylobacterium sp.]|nr:MAG: hypothetical protein CTY25_02425 [Methylobacterium sp.]